MQPVFRFAPSPNGRLHLGHAYSALLNQDFARRWRGRFLLRIEDIDVTRCPRDLAVAAEEDLGWLGLAWEKPVRRQSDHFGDYAAASASLKGRGLLYPCFCSRKDIAETVANIEHETRRAWVRDPDGAPLYPRTCRALPPDEVDRRIDGGRPHAWRIDMAKALEAAPGPHAFARFDRSGNMDRLDAIPSRWGDAIVVRKDIPTSYHLAVVVDDALQGVTHVVRGMDLEAATHLHVMLQALVGVATPHYHHHGLILDSWGGKLSKSRRSESLAELREQGVMAAEIRQRLGFDV
jgi:glutamyl-Q tRNA(Asp) synthetase